MITIEPVEPDQEEIRALIDDLDALQKSLYPAESNHLDPESVLQQAHVRMFAALEDGVAVACGAVKLAGDYAELKRMYVLESHRGQGIARRLLARLEQEAWQHGIARVYLETGIRQEAALRFYSAMGYAERGPYAEYKTDAFSVYMEKLLQQ